MKVSCTQENLAKGIAKVSRVVGTRGTLPILNHILLQTDKGRLKIAATDLEVGIVSYIGAKVDEEGSITIPARLLSEFIGANPDKTINLETEGTKIKASSDHVTAHLHGLDANDFPLIPEISNDSLIKVKTSDLKDAITQVAFAAASDESRPVLTGVFIKVTEEAMTLVATDSYRLAEKTITVAKSQPTTILVPARTLQEVARLIEGNDTVAITIADNRIGFSFGETTVVSRVLEGNFPDYEQIIPKTKTTTAQVKISDLSSALKLGSTFSRDISNNIRLLLEEGAPMQLVATSPQVGDTTAQIDAKVSGEKLEIAFNAKFLLDVLSATAGSSVTLSFSGSLSPVVVTPETGTGYRALVMPLRLDES